MLIFHKGEAFLPYGNRDKSIYPPLFDQIKLIRSKKDVVHYLGPTIANYNFM